MSPPGNETGAGIKPDLINCQPMRFFHREVIRAGPSVRQCYYRDLLPGSKQQLLFSDQEPCQASYQFNRYDATILTIQLIENIRDCSGFYTVNFTISAKRNRGR